MIRSTSSRFVRPRGALESLGMGLQPQRNRPC